VAADIFSNQSHISGSSAWGLSEEKTTPQYKKTAYYEIIHRVSDLAVFYEHCSNISGCIKHEDFVE
jgi:hypothetical protein